MSSNSFLIGLTGGSGSGKTTFIHELRKRLSESELCILSQDDYYKPRDLQELDENQIRNFDLPDAILFNDMLRDIDRLNEGHPVQRQEYVFNNEKAMSRLLTFLPAPVIMVEGLFVFQHEQLMQKLDLRLFIQAKDNLKVIRRIKRDQIERNYPLEDVLYRYEKHVLPAYEQYIKPYVPLADMVINNNKDFISALDVISGFIKSKSFLG